MKMPPCVVWALLLALLCSRTATADSPIGSPLTPQQQRLKERDRYAEETRKFRAERILAEAIAACEKMLAIEREVFGNLHEDVAESLKQLAEMHEEEENFTAARKARQEVLEIQIRLHGAKDWRVADARIALAGLDQVAQLPADERRLLAEARRLDEEKERLRNLRDFKAAVPILGRVLAIQQKVLRPEHPDTATTLNNLGVLFWSQGDYAAAQPYLEQALAIRKKVFGLEHPDTAFSLNSLGLVLKLRGDYAGAEPYYQQALAIYQKLLGPDNEDTAGILNNLGSLCLAQKDYPSARRYCGQALTIRKKVLGPEHPETAQSLNTLGYLHRAQGDYAVARPYYEQALAIRKKVLGPEHPLTAMSLNNLGLLLNDQGDYAGARRYFEHALVIRKKVLAPEHPDTASSLNNLGLVLSALGNPGEARQYYEQALAIEKKKLPEHPYTAITLNNLGGVLQAQGDYAAAWSSFDQALAIRKKVLSPGHPDTAISLNSLGGLLHAQGRDAEASPYLEQAVAIARRHFDIASSAQAEREQFLMTRSLRGILDAYLSLDPGARLPADSVYQAVLSWKGAILARQRRLHVTNKYPELKAPWNQVESTSRRLQTLSFAVPDLKRVDLWRKQIEELTRERESLERELQSQSAAFQMQWHLEQLTPSRLQQELPAGAVLIDLLQYTHYSPPPAGKGKLATEERLTAFVVRADRPVVRLDLGPAEPIAAAVERWRAEVMGNVTAPPEREADAAADLRRLVWQPLERHLRGVQSVLISPDGALAHFPFAALPGSNSGTYLIEDLPVAVIPVPQYLPQLLAEKQESNTANSLFLVGDVDFGASPGKSPPDTFTGQVAMRGSHGLNFPRLPGTAGEIASIQAAFEHTHPNAAVYTARGAAATEEAFRREARGKRYLHLATHGFFAPPELMSVFESAAEAPSERDKTIGVNPGLLSGLALAGSNRGAQMAQDSPELSDDGILTALEVAELDLSSADLVVLSACETGLGKVAGGEGLLGLQRAFQVAGARSVVASLWKVDDQATRELMTRFYDHLWRRRLPPLEALRQAQLAILNNPSLMSQVRGLGAIEPAPTTERKVRAHPRLWAAWVLSGDPGNLTRTVPVDRARATATQAEIGGTLAGLILMLTGLSALQARRLARGRVR